MLVARFFKVALPCFILVMVMISVDLMAQTSSRRRGLYGDWKVIVDFDGMKFDSILSFSRNREGQRTARWISLMGVDELKDVKIEENAITFTHERQNRDGQTMTSKFKGTIADGKISGAITNDRGEYKVEGARMQRRPRAIGSWETKFKVGEREITNTLVIKADKEGNLAADWKSQRVKHNITEVKYERGKLTFKNNSKMDDRQWASTFEGNIRGGTISGVLKSERGEMAIEGKLIGAPLVGTWNLEVNSERGNQKQRLRINPDMSALFGATAIDKVTFQDGTLSFKIVLEFNDQKFEINFSGKIEESKLTGELTSPMGSQKITGTKVIRRASGRRPSRRSQDV